MLEKDEDLEDGSIVVSIVPEGPASLEDEEAGSRGLNDLRFRKELQGRVARKHVLEKKEGLLRGDLIGEGNRFGKGNVEFDPPGELGLEQGGAILKEGFFDTLGRDREKGDDDGKKGNTYLEH